MSLQILYPSLFFIKAGSLEEAIKNYGKLICILLIIGIFIGFLINID